MKQRYMAVVDDRPSDHSCLIPSKQLDSLGVYESTSDRAAARCAVEAVKRGVPFGSMRIWVEAYTPCLDCPIPSGSHVVHRFDVIVKRRDRGPQRSIRCESARLN